MIAVLTGLCLAFSGAQSGAERPAPALGLVRWRIAAEQSSIGFDGESTLHDFTAKTRDIAGEVRMDPRDPEHSAGGEVSIGAASLDSDSSGRDRDMKKSLEVERFPRIRFELDSLAGRVVDGAGDLSASGRFTIHGVERERTCSLKLAPIAAAGNGAPHKDASRGPLHATGDVRFRMSEHRIEPPSVLVVTVDDEVRVWFDLRLEPVAATPVAARAASIDVATHTEPLGGAASDQASHEQVFATSTAALWERDARGHWLVAGASPGLVDARAARRMPLPATCEELFAETRDRAASIRAKLDALAPDKRAAALAKVSETLNRLDQALAIAPTAEGAQVERNGGTLLVTIGGVEWLRAEGLAGDEPFLRSCEGLEGLPTAVRKELDGAKGLPRELALRCATPAGLRTLRVHFDGSVPTSLPAWAFDVDAWTSAPSQPGR
jgi:polyisoprenoid-binding protein YceI